MMYEYITLDDNTLITHSQLLDRNGHQEVEVHFEKPIDGGFCSARFVLPSYQLLFNDGYTAKELAFFVEFLHHNAEVLFDFASEGGAGIA